MSRRLSTLFVCLVTGSLASQARATSLPETYPLNEADLRPSPIDPNLDAWLKEHVERSSPFELKDAEFLAYLPKQDLVTKLYLQLARANRAYEDGGKGKTGELVRVALDQALKHLASEGEVARNETLSHPLLPFLYLEILRAPGATPEQMQPASLGMTQYGAGSCAQKQLVFESIDRDSLTGMTEEDLKRLLSNVQGFKSESFRRSALRRFATNLPESKRAQVKDRLYALMSDYPALTSQYDWLRTGPFKPDENAPALALFEQARKEAVRKQCSKAKTDLMDGLALIKSIDGLNKAMNAAKAIDGCYRQRDAESRRLFWDHVAESMNKAFQTAGWAEVKLRIGYIYWSGQELANAKQMFTEVAVEATKQKQLKYVARAIYALGRIAQDEGSPELAMQYFRDYLARFPTEENFEDSVMALTLLHVDKKDWVNALAPLEAAIHAQTQMPMDERSAGVMSFALFWVGRIHLEQGRLPLAEEMWRRLASEYYSTYYGAIGHYMLEQILGKKLALQPARTPSFRMDVLRQNLTVQDRQRVRRAEALMRQGLRREAICEVEELDVGNNQPERQLIKALMLHASGQWLDAIKVYDALPRGFRYTLPVGFERILFPRRYADVIKDYSKRLDVDPDIVMAIIRQESVFNPAARSPVGAVGLMQLMPRTAQMEVSRLGKNYVPPAERAALKQHAQSELGLMIAESNLAIGIHHVKTLIGKYSSPVFVLSAYNASPAAAARWAASIPTNDILAFIEKIPYKETRAYVKLVLRNYFYYKRWYGTPTESLRHFEPVASPLLAALKNEKAAAAAAAAAAGGAAAPAAPAGGATAPNH